MVYLFESKEKISADLKEIYRYAGMKTYDNSLEDMVLKIKDETEKWASFKLVYTKIPINCNKLDFGYGEIYSKSLSKNLKDCKEVYIFAATLGVEIDRMINRYLSISPSKAVIAQSAGAALIEKYCDIFIKEIISEEEKNGNFIRPRFSPGYGDFHMDNQKQILNLLSASKSIGVSLTKSLLMVPTKSVTALMGVSHIKTDCNLSGCELCLKKDCLYKRG